MKPGTEKPENHGREAQLVEMARRVGVLRARDLESHGIARVYLKVLVDRGILVQAGRGLYALADAPITEYQTLLETMVRVPRGVICLASALRYHNLTTQNPWKVWLMIESGSRVPKMDYPPLLIFQASGASFTEGVETHVVDGIELRVTSIAKTVADCFKYRNKIGLDVALEALQQALVQRRATRQDIRRFARLCRVERILSPYLEAYSI
jgi:predicted transcriptional regulator of viral defense system